MSPIVSSESDNDITGVRVAVKHQRAIMPDTRHLWHLWYQSVRQIRLTKRLTYCVTHQHPPVGRH